MTHTNTNGAPTPPVIPGGDELYAQIMGNIEPDLLVKNKALLEEKYKNENKKDQKIRMDRYTAAFAEYETQYMEYQKKQSKNIKAFGGAYVKHLEKQDRASELDALTTLESTIQNS